MGDWIAVGLFLFAAAVQYNDPDPIRWIAMYLAAAAVALIVAIRRSISVVVPLAIGVVALVWATMIASSGPNLAAYARMFDAWEMKSEQVEEAREAGGLLIVSVWMVVVAARMWIRGPNGHRSRPID